MSASRIELGAEQAPRVPDRLDAIVGLLAGRV
jgi:hypothetical protein